MKRMMKGRFSGWRIFSVRGVDVRIHISLAILVVYIMFVASAQFPFVVNQSRVDPTMLFGNPWIWAAIFAVGLFASVILHEFGHVFVAQSMGVKVRGVTLMMLGGVSEMERTPEKGISEFKMSIVGPLVSLAIAGIFLFLASNTRDSAPNLAFFSYWIGRVNLVLAVFNLLPAFPLDGGRALRSLLSVKYGLTKATFIAARVAKVFAWILGILGFISFNFLLMLIAFFIYAAASGELAISVSRSMLKDASVREVAVRTEVVDHSVSLDSAATIMRRTGQKVLPVEPWAGETGLIDVEALRQVPQEEWTSKSVREIVDVAPRTVDMAEQLDDLVSDIAAAGALPVTENGRVVGIINYEDLKSFVEIRMLDRDLAA